MTESPHAAAAAAIPPQLAPTSHTVLLHGEEVAYWHIPGTGPTVVLVHGVGASSTTWELVMQRIAARGAEVVAVDLPGHGRSSKPRGDYSLGAMASTLRDLLDHLGRTTCVLVGHSLGGGIALQFVYQFPTRVERLVLVSSGGLGSETFPLLRAATLPGAELIIPLLANARTVATFEWIGRTAARINLHPDAFSEDAVSTLREISEPRSRAAFLATLRSVVDISGQKVSALSKLPAAAHIPTLLVWGDRDPVIPVTHGIRAHELLPQSTLIVFKGAGHEPHSYDAVRFAQLVSDFAAGDSVK